MQIAIIKKALGVEKSRVNPDVVFTGPLVGVPFCKCKKIIN
ncbi:hypothetical protein [uncultured Dokdonia sp.]|nr:hypothetical protein [uncultured Dokdonia sp.]